MCHNIRPTWPTPLDLVFSHHGGPKAPKADWWDKPAVKATWREICFIRRRYRKVRRTIVSRDLILSAYGVLLRHGCGTKPYSPKWLCLKQDGFPDCNLSDDELSGPGCHHVSFGDGQSPVSDCELQMEPLLHGAAWRWNRLLADDWCCRTVGLWSDVAGNNDKTINLSEEGALVPGQCKGYSTRESTL